MRIAICDDEQFFIEHFTKIITDYYVHHHRKLFGSACYKCISFTLFVAFRMVDGVILV